MQGNVRCTNCIDACTGMFGPFPPSQPECVRFWAIGGACVQDDSEVVMTWGADPSSIHQVLRNPTPSRNNSESAACMLAEHQVATENLR